MAPSVHVRGTCKALDALGHSVALIHKAPTGSKKFSPEWLNLICEVSWPEMRGGWKLFQIQAAFRLLQIVRKWKPDVIYIRSSLGRTLEWALRRCNVSVIVEINGNEIFENPATRRSFHVCDLILVDNIQLAKDIITTFPEHGSKVRTHLTFVTNAEHFRPMEQAVACNLLRLDRSVLRLLHVSSFQHWHDFNTMIQAVRLLEKRFQGKIELQLLGDGPAWDRLQACILTEKLDGIVKMPGRVSHGELPNHIAASDITIDLLTSKLLEQGRNMSAVKIYEYMACSRAVITAVSQNYSAPEWARDNLALIPPEDPNALAAAIEDIAGAPMVWAEKAQKACQHVRQHHTWHAATETTLAHLQTLVEQRETQLEK
jgi:glycosyltransferase involved in cell wall biosynthesis